MDRKTMRKGSPAQHTATERPNLPVRSKTNEFPYGARGSPEKWKALMGEGRLGSVNSGPRLKQSPVSSATQSPLRPATQSPTRPTTQPRPILPTQHPIERTSSPQLPPKSLLRNAQPPWAGAKELKVAVRRLPEGWSTLDIYRLLRPYGNLVRIEVFADRSVGYVTFRPPPTVSQWIYDGLTASDKMGTRHRVEFSTPPWTEARYPSPADPKRTFPEFVEVSAQQLSAGVMPQEDCMLALFTTNASQMTPVTVCANTKLNELELKFSLRMSQRQADGSKVELSRSYKICTRFSQIQDLRRMQTDSGDTALVIRLLKPPMVYRKTDNVEKTHESSNTFWNDTQTWYRQTAIANQLDPRNAPTQLRTEAAIFDIGRWLTYRLILDRSIASSQTFGLIGQILIDHNLALPLREQMPCVTGRAEDLWSWNGESGGKRGGAAGSSLHDLHSIAPLSQQLDFAVRYQLEVCLSQSLLHECNLSDDFLQKLAALEVPRATQLLEKIADQAQRYYDPMNIFRLQSQVSSKLKKIPRYCAMIPSAVITPTTIYFTTPVMETSNRVIRQYRQHGDRFLRVKFTDERYRGKIRGGDDNAVVELLTRVKRTMRNGILIGNRRYEFLAFGNAQFREHGAYFFAPTGTTTADAMRQWMGNFTRIPNVAKYASRIGQCFSTTRAMSISVKIEGIPDIERNGFNFTDGVGKISPFIAQMIADEYGLASSSTDSPSVFQFRLGGCKGVLAVDPTLKGQLVQIRPSQEKFPARYQGLEICRVSQYSSANINVQIILVLDALGVQPPVFLRKMANALKDMAEAMTSPLKAIEQLSKKIDYNQVTLLMADMIYDGFMAAQDPFMISCLHLWRSWMVKYLKEKAKIFIDDGAFVVGCVDETATLKGHYDVPATPDGEPEHLTALPEIFLQITDATNKGVRRVVEGVCILARNPSLHPGDIRVVRAIDVPQLHHLRDCVVLPQTGDRDLANMCSGGDLDGDDYLVIWDPELIPEERNHAPMDYQAPPPVLSDGPVTVDAMTSFFVNHMKNDNLSRIAVAHKYWADRLHDGVKSNKCLQLAQLHSMAVDYAKTGVPAEMPRELRISQWPHWAEVKNQSGKRVYHSNKVIGQLYDEVKRVPFQPAWHLPFDQRILDAYELSDEILDAARVVKQQYDEAVRRIIAQQGMRSEFEVWTTFALEHSEDIGDYKFTETLGEIVTNLKQHYREQCYEKMGTTTKERDWAKIGPFVAAMYTVTASEVATAWAETQKTKLVGGRQVPIKQATADNMPFMSFPWIFYKELGHVAKGCTPTSKTTTTYSPSLLRKPAPKTTTSDPSVLGLDFTLPPLQDIRTAEGIIHEGDLLDVHHTDDAEVPPRVASAASPAPPEPVNMPPPPSDAVGTPPQRAEPALSSEGANARSRARVSLGEILTPDAEGLPPAGIRPADGDGVGGQIAEAHGCERIKCLDAEERRLANESSVALVSGLGYEGNGSGLVGATGAASEFAVAPSRGDMKAEEEEEEGDDSDVEEPEVVVIEADEPASALDRLERLIGS